MPYSSYTVLQLYLCVHPLKDGLQNQHNKVTVCFLVHDALPSYRHGVPTRNRRVNAASGTTAGGAAMVATTGDPLTP